MKVAMSGDSSFVAGFYIYPVHLIPKFPWLDDVKIVGNRIAEVRPVPGNRFAQESKRRIGELGASCTAFVARDVSVHEAP
jgi:hypothetical protein